MYIHKEGYIHIAIATALWITISYINYKFFFGIPILYWLLQIVFFLLWFWVLWFFRIPKRVFTQGEGLIISPCDGKVVIIEETDEPEYYQGRRLQVSIFMSPLNVHVNRSPISGKVKYVKYHPGKYLVAWHPKSSTLNERTTVVIENNKINLLLRQIAGAVARRIVYYVKAEDNIQQNDEFGFIKFGSRVDIFLPVGTQIDVQIGAVVKGGQTIIGRY